MSIDNVPINKIDDVTWEIPTSYKKGMKVPARFILTPELKKGLEMRVVNQITNVATLPGVVKHALALPDTHTGYGFPIAKDKEHLEQLKDENSYWHVSLMDYTRGNKNPFVAVASMILFIY